MVKKNVLFIAKYDIQSNLSIPSPFGSEEFAQFRQVFGLHRFKLPRHLVDGTEKSLLYAVFRFSQDLV
jgi:hypothetical protein